MGGRVRWMGLVGTGLVACASAAVGAAEDAPHPFLLWTRQEAHQVRRRLESDPLARKQFEAMVALETGRKGTNKALLNLFKYSVLGDQAAGEAEKKALRAFIGARPPSATAGNPATRNAPWRDDRTLDALRYDILHDGLTGAERQGVEDTIRFYVRWHQENPGPWRHKGRTGWLPNMQWPTAAGIHVLAAASRDEGLIRQMFESFGGWKWFFDHYVADGRFYMEEFGKSYSNIGSMILWCQALERLGLDRYGWDYTGRGGATVRDFLGMLLAAGYPRVERPGGTPDYPTVHMGDASPLYILNGYNADGTGGTAWWRQAMMNGPIPKMMQPLWWEAGHKKFPDAGFDYFLAQMRKPGEDVYLPTLYFGLGPIDPAKVKPPRVRSYVAPERGFALLRAEEGPAYWESPKPAVALQFGMYYVHYVHDCFSILQYVSHNRFIYAKMGAAGKGYAGGDPWRDHVRGQGSGVVVDGLQAQFVDDGEDGVRNERVRHHFSRAAKFVAVAARGIYPDVEQERALVLTDAYLFDAFWLRSGRPRVYDWHVLAPAAICASSSETWTPIETLTDGRLRGQDLKRPLLTQVRVRDTGGGPWAVTLLQQPARSDATGAGTVGVNVSMLAAEGTALVAGRPPGLGEADVGTALVATRTVPATIFAALHEPFQGSAGAHRIERYAAVAESDAGIAVAVVGKADSGINDRIIVRTGLDAARPARLAGDGESFTVADFAWLRIGPDKVEAWGGLTGVKVKAAGSPTLVLNGRPAPAKAAGGYLEYSAGP